MPSAHDIEKVFPLIVDAGLAFMLTDLFIREPFWEKRLKRVV